MNSPLDRFDGGGTVVGIVSGGHLLSHFYLLAFPPLFPLLARDLGLSNTELGLIVSVMTFPVMALQLFVGQLVDRIGAKRVFVAGVAVTGAMTFLAGFAPGYPVLLGCAFVAGIGQSCFHPSDYALLSAVVPSKNEGKGFSIHTFGGYAGFASAPLLIGGIGVATDWRTALRVAGVVGVAYAVFARVALDPVYRDQLSTTDRADARLRDELRVLLSPALLATFVFFVFLFMAGTGIQSFTTVFLVSGYGLAETTGNSALTVFFALSAVGVLGGGVVADRYDIHAVIVVALTVAAAVTVLIATRSLPPVSWAVLTAFAVVGLFSGVMRPARDRLVSTYSPPDSSGRSFGFVFSGGSLGGFVSPVLLGFVLDTRDIELPFLLVGGFLLACAVIVALVAVGAGETGADRDR